MLQDLRCKICGNIHPGQPCATNPIKFQWKYSGNDVGLYGSWSHFQVPTKLERSPEPPYFHECVVNLLVGIYTYKYYVDGQWKFDENTQVPDNFGSFNNQVCYGHIVIVFKIEILPKRVFQIESDDQNLEDEEDEEMDGIVKSKSQSMVRTRIRTFMDSDDIQLVGSWDDWKEPIKLERRFVQFQEQFENYTFINLWPYESSLIFFQKRNILYSHDQQMPCLNNQFDSFNNIITVKKHHTHHQQKAFKEQLNFSQVFWKRIDIQDNRFDRIHGHSMTRIVNSFYIFGGAQSGTYSNEVQQLVYKNHNLQLLNVEDVKGDIPEPRAHHHSCCYGNKILFYGGLNNQTILQDHIVFNVATNTWSKGRMEGELPSPRERATLTFYQKEEILIYFGGYYCSYDMEAEEIFNDVHCMNIRVMKWKKLEIKGDLPAPRYGHTATQIKSQMYVFGGVTNNLESLNKNFQDLWRLNFKDSDIDWVQIKDFTGQPPEPRHGHTATLIQTKICIFGGRGNKNKKYNDVFFFDIKNSQWIQPNMLGDIPAERFYHAADAYNDNQIWILGGNAGMKQTVKQINFIYRKHQSFYIMTFEDEVEVHFLKKKEKQYSEEEEQFNEKFII